VTTAHRCSPHPFSGFVKVLGRGKTARRALTDTEAEEAFGMILDGAATEAQIGAFLMLLRVKEETPDEVAGMVRAARARCSASGVEVRVDLEWPSYAGKRQHHPWYLLSALLLAGSGRRVLMHGCSPHAADRLFADAALQELGIAPAASWSDMQRQLDARHFSYLPLGVASPALQALMDRRAEFGLRSPVNTLVRHIDPARARAGLRSLHHPAYAALHVGTALALGSNNVAVFRGEGGECEVRADADTPLSMVRAGSVSDAVLARSLAHRSPKPECPSVAALRAVWDEGSHSDYGIETVLSTAAVALLALDEVSDMDSARDAARQLWQRRSALPDSRT